MNHDLINNSQIIKQNFLSWHRLRRWTLWYFILAAVTGLVYRLAMAGWNPAEFNISFLRHAHSHLMFFGWAAPAPMIYMAQYLQDKLQRSLFWMRFSIAASLVLGLCSYPFFLFYGYRSVALGSAELPLAAIFSGMVMLAWYIFMISYISMRSSVNTTRPLSCFDGALFLLFLGSLGAWGVSVVQAMGLENPFWGKGLTHLFLTSFTEGWVILSILGILYSEFDISSFEENDWLLIWPLLVGVPLLFPFGMSISLLSNFMLIIARIGGVLVGLILLLHLWKFRREKSPGYSLKGWYLPLFLLIFKIAMQWGASLLPSSFWMGQHGLRVFYLHVTLLGIATPILLLSYRKSINYLGWIRRGMEFSIGFLLLTLLPLTPIWPAGWSGLWIFVMLSISAALPPLAALSLLIVSKQ